MTRSSQLRSRIHLVALSLSTLFLNSAARAGSGDEIEEALSAARLRYETAMENIRSKVPEEIARDIAQEIKRPRPDDQKIGDLQRQESDFRESGKWPSPKWAKRLHDQAERAKEDLAKAMEKAKIDLTRAARYDAAKSLEAEREHFLKENDAAPWREIPTKDSSGAPLTVGATLRSFELGDQANRNYRLDVVVHRSEGGDPLTLNIPIPGGKEIELDAITKGNPEVRVLLSVRGSLISPDLGPPRPVSSRTKEESSGNLTLHARQGVFAIKSIRFKPIFEDVGQVAQDQQAKGARRPAEAPAKNDPASQLTEKSTWSFDRWRSNNPNNPEKPQAGTATVVRRNENRVTFKTTRFGGVQGSFTFELAINGGNLKIVRAHVDGGAREILSDLNGGGWVNGDEMEIEFTARVEMNNVNAPYLEKFQMKRNP